MIPWKHAVIVLSLVLVLSACGPKEPSGCPLPPKAFSNSDLIGTWHSPDPLTDVTLTIGEDERYKQAIYVKRTGFSYETDWQPWRLAYSRRGIPYLHLERMVLCDAYYYDVECNENTVKASGSISWYDFCEKDWVDMRDEGVLMVLGVLPRFNQPPRGVLLVPFTKSSDGPTGPAYRLQVP